MGVGGCVVEGLNGRGGGGEILCWGSLVRGGGR